MSRSDPAIARASEWLNDERVRSLSPASRGAWIDLLAILFAAPNGYATVPLWSSASGIDQGNLNAILEELIALRLVGIDADGRIKSKRVSRTRSERARARARLRRVEGKPPLPEPTPKAAGLDYDVPFALPAHAGDAEVEVAINALVAATGRPPGSWSSRMMHDFHELCEAWTPKRVAEEIKRLKGDGVDTWGAIRTRVKTALARQEFQSEATQTRSPTLSVESVQSTATAAQRHRETVRSERKRTEAANERDRLDFLSLAEHKVKAAIDQLKARGMSVPENPQDSTLWRHRIRKAIETSEHSHS